MSPRGSAAERLARVEERLDWVKDGVETLNETVKACANEVQLMKPQLQGAVTQLAAAVATLDDYREKRAQARGMLKLAGITRMVAAAVIGSGLTGAAILTYIAKFSAYAGGG